MNTKKISDAMNGVNDKYIEEAICYRNQIKKGKFIKWSAAVACLALICTVVIRFLPTNNDTITDIPGLADIAPMIYVNDTLYMQSTNQTSYDSMKEDFIFLGKIESDITSLTDGEYISNGEPKLNFQSNIPIVGCKVYGYEDNVVVLIDSKYWLYEKIDITDDKLNQGGLTEEEKMQQNPTYKR